MTINVGEFTNWQAKGDAAHDLFPTCSPNLVLIGAELKARYGTANLGCKGVRTNRAGTSDSTHSFGAAKDESFRLVPATDKRRVMLEAIEWLKQNSKELGIQAIHDYLGSRIWRSNRDANVYPDGWKIQAKDASGMGQTWADWIHVEVHERGWYLTNQIASRLLAEPVKLRPTIGLGSRGPLVKAIQEFLTERANQGEVVGNADGIWGPRTQLAWSNFVIWTTTLYPGSMTTDGNVDGIDWNLVAWNDGGWERLYAAGFPRGV